MISLESIIDAIDNEKKKLNEEYSYDPGYFVCEQYVEQNRISALEDLMHINIKSFIHCLIYVKSAGKISLQRAYDVSETIVKIFDGLDSTEFKKLMCIMIVLPDYIDVEKIHGYLSETDDSRADDLLLEVPEKSISFSSLIGKDVDDVSIRDSLKGLREMELSTGGVQTIIDFADAESEIVSDLFAFYACRKDMEDDMKKMQKASEKYKGISQKKKRRAFHNYLRENYSIGHISQLHGIISNFVSQIDNEKNAFEKARKRKLYNYDRSIALLKEASGKKEITNAREIIKGIADEKIQKMVLLWIRQQNNQVYQELDNRLQELNSNSISLYIAVLNRYRISMDVSDISSFMHHTPDELDKILSSLPISMFSLEQLLEILQITNIMVAQKVRGYLNLGYIGSDCLINNLDLYSSSMDKLKKMDIVCGVLNSYDINPCVFSKTPTLFWSQTDVLSRNVSYLNAYHLKSAIRTTLELDFLFDPSMVEKIDLFVELGYYNFLQQNLGVLNFSKKRIQRLELLRVMNIVIDDAETLYDVLNNNHFIVKDENLEQYLLDVVPYKEPLELDLSVEDLENRFHDKVTLSIGNVCLSLPKIKRRVAQGEPIGKAIFYGRHYSEDEYHQIVQGLSSYSRR